MYPTSGAVIRSDINLVVEQAYRADELLIGAQVMPPLAVAEKSSTFLKIEIAKGALMDAVATERSRGGSYGRISRQWTSDNYDCVDRGLEEAVDDTDQKDLRRFFNAEATAAKLTMRNVKLAHEQRVAAAIFNPTNFGSATNSTVAYEAANLATIDAPADILAAIERVSDYGQMPDTIVIPGQVFNRLKLSAKLQAWVRGSLNSERDAPITAQAIADSFRDHGIKRVLLGRGKYNTGKKGAAASISQIWANTYMWVGATNQGALTTQDGGAGFTMYWNAEGGLFVTETYRNESARSNMVRVRQNTTEKVVDGTAGTLIATQYA